MPKDFEGFDDDTVIEPTDQQQVSQEDISDDPSKDTFENAVYHTNKDSQVSLLDEEEDAKPQKLSKKEDEKEKSDGDGKSSVDDKEEGEQKAKEGEEDAKEQPDPQSGPILKLKDGDKTLDVSADATVKVKVNGKSEFVSIADLKSEYSGKKAWSDKIEEANTKIEEAEANSKKHEDERNEIIEHMQEIAKRLDAEDGDPLEALYYLLDLTGRDVHNYSKRIFDFMEEQIGTMSEMDDSERELFWTKKKLDTINSNQAAKAETAKQEQARQDLIAKVDQLRESHGVSESEYVQAHRELVQLGYQEDNLTPEQIIRYSAIKPHVERAEKAVQPFEEDLSSDEMDALISETASIMQRRPQISEEDAISIAARMLGYDVETVDDDIDELNNKVQNRTDVTQRARKVGRGAGDESHFETFDDFDEGIYQNAN